MNYEVKAAMGPFRTQGEHSYEEVLTTTEFHDSFGKSHVLNAYRQHLERFKESFQETIEELDEQDTYNIRYYEGCVEAIDFIVGNHGHGTFHSIVQDCDKCLEHIDEQSNGINKQNDYWRRYFDGQVQTLMEIKKESEKWEEIMGWVEAFDND